MGDRCGARRGLRQSTAQQPPTHEALALTLQARRVRRHADFLGHVGRQLAWLARNRETSWIDRFRIDLIRVTGLLDRYPAAGALLERQGATALRRVILASTPYVAWYVYDEERADGEVILVRVFHTQQRRPAPDPSRWLSRTGDPR